jgi:uncharacterized protein YbaR (Trm112 family)
MSTTLPKLRELLPVPWGGKRNRSETIAADKKRKRLETVVLPALRCVRCGGHRLELTSQIACLDCNQTYPLHNSIPLMVLEPEKALEFDEDVVVENRYSSQWLELIHDADDQMVLDLGSGNNPDPFDHVMKMDIFPLPNVDVVGLAENLPFRDGVFRTVISGAVFEHVCHPFEAIENVRRVLSTDGEVYIETAFLQPVHAFPNHYFNMSLSGLELLCSEFDHVKSGVQPHQMPSFMLRWVLQSWVAKLDGANQADFLNTTVGQILQEYSDNVFSTRWMESFSELDMQELACGVFFHGRK